VSISKVCAQSFISQKVTVAAATARTALRKRLSSSMALSSKEKTPASQGSEVWLAGLEGRHLAWQGVP
jgi:hypothetical protein